MKVRAVLGALLLALAGCSSAPPREDAAPTKVQVLASRPKDDGVYLDGRLEHEALLRVFFISGPGDLVVPDPEFRTRIWRGLELAPRSGEWATAFAGPRTRGARGDGKIPVLGLATGFLVRARTLGFDGERVKVELEARCLDHGTTVRRARRVVEVLRDGLDGAVIPLDETAR